MRVYRNMGEDFDDVCPGESNCDDWNQPWEAPLLPEDGCPKVTRIHEQKEEAICLGCRFFTTKRTAAEVAAFPDDDLEDIADEIAGIVQWEDAGFATDWSCYSFAIKQLVVFWRDIEAEIRNLQQHRLQAFIQAWMTQK